MPLVHDVDPIPGPDDAPPAWIVELQAKVGPFTRSKRLRMVRTVHRPGERVRFERSEADDRSHAPWVLTADLEPLGDATRLTMTLRYGGRLWTGGVLERVLDDQVRQGSETLLDLVTSPTR